MTAEQFGLTQTKQFELIAIPTRKGQSRAIAQDHAIFSMEHRVQFFDLFDIDHSGTADPQETV